MRQARQAFQFFSIIPDQPKPNTYLINNSRRWLATRTGFKRRYIGFGNAQKFGLCLLGQVFLASPFAHFQAKGCHRYRPRLRRNNTYSAPLPPSCGRASAKARICGDKGWRFNQSGTWPRRIPAPLPVMTRTQRHPSRAAVSINCAKRLSARAAVRPCRSSVLRRAGPNLEALNLRQSPQPRLTLGSYALWRPAACQ